MKYLLFLSILFCASIASAEGTTPDPSTVFQGEYTLDINSISALDTIQMMFRDRTQYLIDEFSMEDALVVETESGESVISFTMDPSSSGPFSSFGVISYDLADWGDTVYLILRLFTILPACIFSIRLIFTGT